MTPAEAAALLTICAAYDNRKPDADAAKAWAMAMDGYRFEDCRTAVVEHYRVSREWIMPADVIAGVKRVRGKRLQDYGYVMPPPELSDNPAAEHLWTIKTKQAIADGTIKPGDEPEPPLQMLNRVMPDWDRMLPAPEPVKHSHIVAESRRAKDPDFDRRMEEARASLEPLRQQHAADRAEQEAAAEDEVDA